MNSIRYDELLQRVRDISEDNNIFQTIVDTVPAMVFWKDKNNNFLGVNKAYEQTIRIPREELLSKNVKDLFPDPEKYLKDDLDVINTGVPKLHIIESITTPKGTIWVKTDKVPLKNTAGEIIGVIGISIDITELKRTQDELSKVNAELEARVMQRTLELAENVKRLEESEQQIHIITNMLPDLVAYIEPGYRYKWMNEAYLKWFGQKDLSVFLGRNMESVLGNEGFSKARPYADMAFAGNSVSYETHIRFTDGIARYIYARYVPDIGPDGKVRGIVVLASDISERKLAEGRFETAFKNAFVGLTISDSQGKYLMVNPAFEKITGYSREELLKLDLLSITHPEDRNTNSEQLRKLLDGEIDGYMVEKRYVRKDQNIIWVRVNASPLPEGNGREAQILALIQDITAEKLSQEQISIKAEKLHQINQELSRKNEQLLRTNNDLDNFIYTASHDLKAPVSNIEGLVNTLKDVVSDKNNGTDSTVEYILGLIKVSINKFQGTIKDLTEVSKTQKNLDEDSADEINIVDLIEDVKFNISNIIKENNATLHINTEECPVIRSSRPNLKSILHNLITNGIKYRRPDVPPVIDIRTYMVSNRPVIEVRDNGLGIKEEHQDKVFQMFKRLHDHVEGSGIGLYIVKRIVENAGGKIELESEINKGSTFRIWLGEKKD